MTVRSRALVADEWQAFRDMRLLALKSHPGLYATTYERSLQAPTERWQELLDGIGKQVFGLFLADSLIGITAVFTDREDPSGRTAIFAMSFIVPEYRGRGLSRLLYEARISWALTQPQFDRIVLAARSGNEPSQRASRAFGFQLINQDSIVWPDGTQDIELHYELNLVELRRRAKAQASMPD